MKGKCQMYAACGASQTLRSKCLLLKEHECSKGHLKGHFCEFGVMIGSTTFYKCFEVKEKKDE